MRAHRSKVHGLGAAQPVCTGRRWTSCKVQHAGRPRLVVPARASAASVPWLPPQLLKTDTPDAASNSAKLATWANAITSYSAYPVGVATFVYIFWHQSLFKALLGSQLQVLMLMLMPLFMAMVYGAGLLQHEYESFQASAGWEGPAADPAKTGNRRLRELMGRTAVVLTCMSMLAFSAAALGLTPAVMAVAALASVAFAGPYQPVLEPEINGKKALRLSTWVFAGSQPVLVLYGWALWQLLGAKGLLVLGCYVAGTAAEILSEVHTNLWLHPFGHLFQLAHMPLLLYFMADLFKAV